MLISSTLTITIVKVAKCVKKKNARTRIADLVTDGEERHVEKEKLFRKRRRQRLTDDESIELAEPKHALDVPGHHQGMSQNELL